MAVIKKAAVKKVEAEVKAEPSDEPLTDSADVVEVEDGGVFYPGGIDEPSPQQKLEQTLAKKAGN